MKLPFLSDAHHYAIAAVATRAAQLDSIIEIAIWSICASASLNRACGYILKNMNGDRYVGLLHEMFLDELPDLSELIDNVFEDIRKLRTERNEILHWLYGQSEDPLLAKSSSMRPFRDIKEKTRTAEEMQETASKFLQCVAFISRWMKEVGDRRGPPLRGTPWPPAPQPNSA